MRQPHVADDLRAIARALKRLKVRWYVFGAQAVIAAGAVRNTADLDITTEDVPVRDLRAALSEAGFILRRDIAGVNELIEHHRILPLEHKTSLFHLDVVRAGTHYEHEMLARPIFRRVGRTKIPFIDTNDLVVLKTLASRPKDLEDVRALLRSGSTEIDADVVRSRLAELGALIDDSTLVTTFDDQLLAEGRRSSVKRPAHRTRSTGRRFDEK